MRLYHGSNVVVERPRIIKSDRRLDFGTGFYTTSDFEQAKRWADLKFKRCEEGAPIVSVYEIDMAEIENINFIRFESADKDWLRYVSKNRKDEDYADSYDMVIGPVANDRTMPVISL